MKTLFMLNGIALAVAGGTALIVAWANRGSSNVVLAVGALIGTIALYTVQLSFELRGTVIRDHVSGDFTIDREERWIRQWKYPDFMSWRPGAEILLGRWLAQGQPNALDTDRMRVTRDFAIRSTLMFLTYTEPDWQLQRTTYLGTSTGSITYMTPVSTARDSTLISPTEIHDGLQRAGNVFAEAPVSIPSGHLRLPPDSTLEITADALAIRNPLCEIQFRVQVPESIAFMKPKTGGDVPTLASGEARYETRVFGVSVNRTFFALRAHDPRGVKYREWTERLVSGLRAWFEPERPTG
jgi:hypothetical protein